MTKHGLTMAVVAALVTMGSPAFGDLVAYWPFDGDYASTVNNGTMQGTAMGVAAISTTEFVAGGGALMIDDDATTASYVDIGNPVVDLASNPTVTVVAWYRYEDISGDGSDVRNFAWESSPNYTLSFGVRNDGGTYDGEWYLQMDSGSLNDISGPVITPGTWNHVAMVWNPETHAAKYYHNGVIRDLVPIPTERVLKSPMDGLHIGNHRAGDGARNWDGYIDEVAVFDHEPTAEQIAGLYDGTYTPATVPPPEPPQLPTGAPVAYWTFDTDYTSEVNNDFYQGTPEGGEFTSISTPAEAKIGSGALKLDSGPESGNGTYVDVQRAVADVTRDRQITISAWYKFSDISLDGSDARNFVWESAPGYSLSFGLGSSAGVRDAEWWFQGIGSDNSGPEVASDEWNHVVMVLDQDAEVAQFYHNGVLRDEVATDGNVILGMTGFHIGNHRAGDGGRDFDGYIDDVAVYHGVLLPEAVAGLYDGTYTPLTVPVAATIPEPGVLTLLGLGALASLLALRRRVAG